LYKNLDFIQFYVLCSLKFN